MKEIGIMERGGTAAVIKERRDHIAVFENISDANIITPKRLIGKKGSYGLGMVQHVRGFAGDSLVSAGTLPL